MSGKGSSSATSSSATPIPASYRKMVQSLKEIVSNFPDHEIYATLKDCNMDPNEAVSRLLSQDPFHEVKSKREKKKESKDQTDYRPRGTNNSYGRGGARAGTDRYGGRGSTNQFSSTDPGLLGKPVHKKENGTPAYGGSTSYASGVLGNIENRQPAHQSDSGTTESKRSELGVGDALPSSQQGGLQSAWMGNTGQVSMADIVKMGRPQAKASMHNSSVHSGNHQNAVVPPVALDHNFHSLQGHAPKVSETNTDQGYASTRNVRQNDEWPSIEDQRDVSVPVVADAHANSGYFGEANWQQKINLEEHLAGDDSIENADNVDSASVSTKTSSEDNTGAEDDVSSVAANIEQLNLQRHDQGMEPEEDKPSVVIPNHLQLHTPECMNLSFGSFGSSNNASLSGPGAYTSRPLKNNLEDTSVATDVGTIGSLEARNPDYYGDEHLTSTSDENLVPETGGDAVTYEQASVSPQETSKPEPPEAGQENQYSFTSSSDGFTYEIVQQPEVTFPHSQTSSQMQNLAPFTNVMAYTNSLPSALLASTVQAGREDIPYSPFPAALQSMPAQYSNIISSIGGPTISMSEALRASSISALQPNPNPQTLPGSGVATGPGLPQHMGVHPYSQPTLPLGHFANMVSYPFLPQSYYMPSAFQQGFAGNSTYHQSLAAVLPQYKNSVSVSSLPQSTAIPSGYGFGSSTSIPGGNFPLNPLAAATGTTIGYDDIINSQFKDNNHMISLQQNENSAMWVHGPGSRSMSVVPPNTYYSFQGQNQQPGGFRQRQQQQPQQTSQHFGPPGYPNFYQSQTGISLEPQQQNPREVGLGGPQSQASKQSQQLWQNNY